MHNKRALWAVTLTLACSGSVGSKQRTDGQSPGPVRDGGAAAGPVLNPTDGARLKVIWAEGPGGQRVFAAWYDSMLKTECSFRRAIDGELRCLPLVFPIGSPPSDFVDPACTVPAAVYSNASCNPTAYMRRVDTANACESRERIYARGERIVENRTYWRPDGPAGRCASGAILAMEAAFRLGPELPATMFVKGKAGTPAPASGSMLPIPFEIEDGGLGVDGWQNSALRATCSFWPLGDGKLYCLPEPATLSTVTFSDMTCADQAAYFMPACAAGAPPLVLRPNAGMCPPTYTAFATGPPADGVYRVTNGLCGPIAATLGNEYHSVGAAVPLDGFPTLDAVDESSPNRLHRTLYGPAAGRRTLGSVWNDTDRKESCSLTSFGAGRYRCAPANYARLTFVFADAQCTQPLLPLSAAACPSVYALSFDGAECPARARVHTVGAPFNGPTFTRYSVRNELEAHIECRPTSPPLPADQMVFSVSPVPDEQFAELQRTVP
jgi:hypothetical protein